MTHSGHKKLCGILHKAN